MDWFQWNLIMTNFLTILSFPSAQSYSTAKTAAAISSQAREATVGLLDSFILSWAIAVYLTLSLIDSKQNWEVPSQAQEGVQDSAADSATTPFPTLGLILSMGFLPSA